MAIHLNIGRMTTFQLYQHSTWQYRKEKQISPSQHLAEHFGCLMISGRCAKWLLKTESHLPKQLLRLKHPQHISRATGLRQVMIGARMVCGMQRIEDAALKYRSSFRQAVRLEIVCRFASTMKKMKLSAI